MADIVSTEVIQSAKADAVKVSAVAGLVHELDVKDAESYQAMDGLLARVRQAKVAIEAKLDPIIKPIYDGLQRLYKLKRELLDPLEIAETAARNRMRDFKRAEARQIQVEEAAKREEIRRLEQALAAKTKAEAQAVTEAMRTKLAAQREEIEQQSMRTAATSIVAPVRAVGSGTRTVKRFSVIRASALYDGIARGYLPQEVAPVNMPALERFLKVRPDVNPSVFGLEAYDDIQIVGRS